MSRRSIRAVAATLVLAGCVDDPNDFHLSQDEQGLNVLSSAIWASSDIPVCWDSPGYPEEKGWVRDSIRKTWEAESAIEFIGWGMCNSSTSSGIRIKISDEWPATQKLGNALNNVPAGMLLNFEFERYPNNFGVCMRGNSFRETCIRSIAVHEFGHAIGFAHEQMRPDTPRSCTYGAGAFDIGGDMVIGAWDLGSVMNYCNPVFNNGGMLSPTDIAGVQQMYGSRKPIASVAWNPNRVDAFVHRTDNFVGSTIAGMAPFPITGAPAMVSVAGQPQVFLRGPDARLYTSRFNGTSWNAMIQVAPGTFRGSPAAIARGNQIDVFVRGDDQRLYVNTWNGSSWSGYSALGGVLAGNPVAITDGWTVDVFSRGVDGAVWTARFDGTSWSAVTSLGGVIAGNPAVVYTGGQLSVFARGMNDALWHRGRFLGAWDPGFTQIAPNVFLGDPAVASRGPNLVDVFVRGFDGNLWTNSFTGVGWTGYTSLGGPFLASPTVYSPAPNRLEVLVRGTDSNLYKKSWNGSAWIGFTPMGTTVR